MKLFHNITINVFIKEEEDYDKIKLYFLKLFPFNIKELIEKKKVRLNETKSSTFNNKHNNNLDISLANNSLLNKFMENIKNNLSISDKSMLLKQLDSRIDQDCNLFMRLSKKDILDDEQYKIVDHGKCFHIKVHVATFPQSKEKAKQIIYDFFEN
ncbi:MAG: RNA-binding domain-containing protein [Candidatus Woesearchaeota archaeon]